MDVPVSDYHVMRLWHSRIHPGFLAMVLTGFSSGTPIDHLHTGLPALLQDSLLLDSSQALSVGACYLGAVQTK